MTTIINRQFAITTNRSARRLGWWTLFGICLLYGGFALFMATTSALAILGVAGNAPHRGAPYWFVLHAFAGGVALITGPLQLNGTLLRRRRRWHRIVGRTYVAAVAVASVAGVAVTLAFGVSPAATVAFLVLDALWFIATAIGLLRIRDRRVAEHREWMLRSFALSCFFITFSLWVPALAGTPLPDAVGYPLAVFLSWSLNLIVAEVWIRRLRPRPSRSRAAVHRRGVNQPVGGP